MEKREGGKSEINKGRARNVLNRVIPITVHSLFARIYLLGERFKFFLEMGEEKGKGGEEESVEKGKGEQRRNVPSHSAILC